MKNPQERLRCVGFFALGILLLSNSSSFAASRSAVLDDSGSLWVVRSGLYEDLFPGGAATTKNAPVLAVDHQSLDGTSERLLVAGSEGPEEDRAASLFFEDSTGSIFLVWESLGGDNSSRLLFAEYGSTGWSEVVDIQTSNGQVSLVGEPRLEVTEDELVLGDGGLQERIARRFFHVAWSEQVASDVSTHRTYYAAVIFEEGRFTGWVPTVRLNDLDPQDEEGPVGFRAGSLPQVELRLGSDARSVIVGFGNPTTGHLVATEVRHLPGELFGLSRDVADFIRSSSGGSGAGGIESLAGGIGAAIVEFGSRFQPGLRAFIAAEVESQVLQFVLDQDSPGIPFDLLADEVGRQIVEIGGRIFGTDGMERTYDTELLRVLRVPSAGTDSSSESPLSGGEGFEHLLRFYSTSRLEAPEIEAEETRLLISEDGSRSLLSWESAEEIHYVESLGGEWTGVRTLPLSKSLSREVVLDLLQQRIDRR